MPCSPKNKKSAAFHGSNPDGNYTENAVELKTTSPHYYNMHPRPINHISLLITHQFQKLIGMNTHYKALMLSSSLFPYQMLQPVEQYYVVLNTLHNTQRYD